MANFNVGGSSFLGTVNVGRSISDGFDLETSAKSVLQFLESRKVPQSRIEVSRNLGLTDSQYEQVIAYLIDAGMVESTGRDELKLSGFGNDALGVFAVS